MIAHCFICRGNEYILPYHLLGVDKYARMGRPYHLNETPPPTDQRTLSAVRILEGAGLKVTVNGESHGHD